MNLWSVHEKLLCEHSAVFNASFGSRFREGYSKKMTLPEDDAGLFEDFVDWLYTQYYIIPKPKPKDDMEHDTLHYNAFRLFVLADKYDVPKLKKGIFEKLLQKAKEGYRPPSLDSIFYVYKNLSERSGMCMMLADWCAPSMEPDWFKNDTTRVSLSQSHAFTLNLAGALAKRDRNEKREKDSLQYTNYTEGL